MVLVNGFNPNAIAQTVIAALEELKARDVQLLDVSTLTDLTNFMIILSGTSSRHVQSIAQKVIELAKNQKIEVLGSEGEEEGFWILVDLGDVIVHVMQPQARAFYNLEGLWNPRALARVGSLD